MFLSIFSKYLEIKNKTVLIIDFCSENNSIGIIFNKKISNNISKFTKNVDYIFLKYLNEKNNYIDFKKIIENNKKIYDYILIDINYKKNSNFYKYITFIVDDIIFLIEPNLIELEKSKNILDIFKNNFKVKKEKIKIIFNKVNKYKIDEKILAELFKKYKILGSIKYRCDYSLYINTNTKHLISDEEHEVIYNKIIRK